MIKVLARLIMLQAARSDPDKTWEEVSIVLTDDAGIQLLNRQCLGVPDTTDVLSFCYDAMPGQDQGHTGEVIVNIERAVAYGKRRGMTGASRELALYIAHGCDHLYGHLDYNDRDRRRMRRRELSWLRKIGRDRSQAVDPVENILLHKVMQ